MDSQGESTRKELCGMDTKGLIRRTTSEQTGTHTEGRHEESEEVRVARPLKSRSYNDEDISERT